MSTVTVGKEKKEANRKEKSVTTSAQSIIYKKHIDTLAAGQTGVFLNLLILN